MRWLGRRGSAAEEDSDGRMEGEEDEGKGCEGEGRVLAICPVVKAPSGQGERAAPWLALHMNMSMYVAHMHTHMRADMGVIVANKNR